MKNKGFTLVELIAVLVVLSLISLIAIPTVNNSLKEYKQKLYDDAIRNLEQSAKNWGADNIGKLPNSVSSNNTMAYPDIDTESEFSTLQIRIKDLQAEGYIGSELKNPKSSKNDFCNCAVVTITKTNVGYTYSILDDVNGLDLLLTDKSGCTC